MFTTVRHFLAALRHESAETARVMAELTDESLGQRVAEGHRTLGELAWHIVISQGNFLRPTGLEVNSPAYAGTPPPRAAQIHSAYVDCAKALASAVERNWTDDTLRLKDEVYGGMWRRGLTAAYMLYHEIHHRGQMTVLMRQAGLKVPGVLGPSKDEEG